MRGIFLSAAVMAALAMSAGSASAKDHGPVQLLGTQTQVTTSTAQVHGNVAVTPIRWGYGYGRGYYGGGYGNYYGRGYGSYYRPNYGYSGYNNYYRPYGSYYRGYGGYGGYGGYYRPGIGIGFGIY